MVGCGRNSADAIQRLNLDEGGHCMATKKSGRKYGKKAQEEVRTEMHHMRSGKHKVKNRKQAIAIGLSKARQKGAKVPRKKAAKK
jgi:hypothetical protein